jgi:hypothetical protein
MGGMRKTYVYTILVGNSEVKKQTGGPRCTWEDNIKVGLKTLGVRVWTGFI